MRKRNTDALTSASEKSTKYAKPVSIFELSQQVRDDPVVIAQVNEPSVFQRIFQRQPAQELLFAKLSVPDELLQAVAISDIKNTLIREYAGWAPSIRFIRNRNEPIESACRFIIFKIEMLEDSTRSFSIRQDYEVSTMDDRDKSYVPNSEYGIWQSNLFFDDARITAHASLIAHLIALMNQQLDLFGNEFTYPLIIAFDYYQNRRQPSTKERSRLHQDSGQFIHNYSKVALIFLDDVITRGTDLMPVNSNAVFSMPVTKGSILVWKDSAFFHDTPSLNAGPQERTAPQLTAVKNQLATTFVTTTRLPSSVNNVGQHLYNYSTGELEEPKRNFLRQTFYKNATGVNLWTRDNSKWKQICSNRDKPCIALRVPRFEPLSADKIHLFQGTGDILSLTCQDPRFLEHTAGGSKIKNRTRKKNNTRRKINKCKNYKNCKKTKNTRVKYGSKIGGDGTACSLDLNREIIIYGTPDLRIPLQITY